MLRLITSFLIGFGIVMIILQKFIRNDKEKKVVKKGSEENEKYRNKRLKFPPEPEVKLEKGKFFEFLKNMKTKG